MSDPKQNCQNCGSELNGEYCSTCGQHAIDLRVPLKELVKELGDELLSFDSRLIHSFIPFLLKPGHLALEYISGKRTRYISPFKLYFFTSFVFFFVMALLREPIQIHPRSAVANTDSLLIATGSDTIFVGGTKGGLKLYTTKKDSTWMTQKLGHRFAAGVLKLQADPQAFREKLYEHIPQIIFALLPMFALLLKLVYVRSKAFYIQHIVFAFYFHSFIFSVLIFIRLLNWTTGNLLSGYADLLVFAIPVNLYFGMRRVYRQSRLKTLLKFSFLGLSYGVLLIVAGLAALYVVILFL